MDQSIYTTLPPAAAGRLLFTLLAGAWGLWLAIWLLRQFANWAGDRITRHFLGEL